MSMQVRIKGNDCAKCAAIPVEIITRNSAKCGDCGDEIESKHRHDFVGCQCGNLFVDGGKAYRKRGFKSGNWTDTSIFTTEPYSGECWHKERE